MPIIFKNQIAQTTSVAVWNISETEDFFLNSLQLLPEDELRIKTIKLQNVRLQKWACRTALAELLGYNNIHITYSETGQPQLKNHYLSFSHTKNCAAVALSKTPVGVDVEKLLPRISKLYPRFMSQDEIDSCNINNLKNLYYFWCAKEAMYKWHVDKNLDFIEDLKVLKNENKGLVCKKNTVQLADFYVDDLVILVCF